MNTHKIDLIPLEDTSIPSLRYWKIEFSVANERETSKISVAKKLATALDKLENPEEHICWMFIIEDDVFVTDSLMYANKEALKKALDTIRDEDKEISKVTEKTNHTMEPSKKASFMAKKIRKKHGKDIQAKVTASIAEANKKLVNYKLYRTYFLKGYNLHGISCLSFKTRTSIVGKALPDVLPSFTKDDWIGKKVFCPFNFAKGTIHSFSKATLASIEKVYQKCTILALKEKLEKIKKGELDKLYMVSVAHNDTNTYYDYVSTTLRLKHDLKEMYGNPEAYTLNNNIYLDARGRRGIFDKVKKDIFIKENYLLIDKDSFPSQEELWKKLERPKTEFSQKKQVSYEDISSNNIMKVLKDYKPYFVKNEKTKVGVITLFPEVNESGSDWMMTIVAEAKEMGIDFILHTGKVCELPIDLTEEAQKIAIEEAIETLKEADVLLVARDKSDKKSPEYESIYNALKKCAFENGLPVQFFFLDNFKYKKNNVVLGLLTKSGVVPYILAAPIACADIFVGLDVCHQKKERSKGSLSFPAAVAFFNNQGKLLQYQTPASSSSEGEIIPKDTLHDFFPKELVANKKVMVLRDGAFKGDEKKNLLDWGKALNTTFCCIEVTKSGSPKIYQEDKEIKKPQPGTAFILNDKEAFLITSTCNKGKGMPEPLLIRNHSPLPLQEVIESVYKLCHLNWSSATYHEAKLPAPMFHADKLAELISKGIVTGKHNGAIPFWV